ncbi:MAG: hypothetical protein K0Q66_282, partial [Chitinophagaceae bacterium]|nr:hypothetical protein [Chitinophagaceae bacterium]
RGIVFCQPQFEPDERVHMAVGNMVYHLLYRPTTFAVRGVELMGIEILDRHFKILWKKAQVCEPCLFLFERKWSFLIFPDGITGISHSFSFRKQKSSVFVSIPVSESDQAPISANYSSRRECPVRLMNTSSRLACFTSLGFSKPLATSSSISWSGEASAMILPLSTIATRSHNTSASSM